jgi:hypothetical protein
VFGANSDIIDSFYNNRHEQVQIKQELFVSYWQDLRLMSAVRSDQLHRGDKSASMPARGAGGRSVSTYQAEP